MVNQTIVDIPLSYCYNGTNINGDFMSSFFRDMVKQIGDPDTHIAADGENSSEFSGTVDTGSYILNAALSGSIFGGVPNNKITTFAGESATGKTFFVMGIVKQFLDDNKDAAVFYYDTEAAVTKQMMEQRGIDVNRVIIAEPETIQKFRHHALQVVENYSQHKDPPPMMMVLDSLGQLSTTKEIEDTASGAETRDMTKAQVLKATFRVLGLKLAKVNVPLLVTNHVYDVVGCLDDSQFVCMADGTYKNIVDIQVGDEVLTENGSKNVSALYEYDVDEYYEMTLEDGSIIKATPNHKFKTVNGDWKRIDELSESDELAELSVEVSYDPPIYFGTM
jgi:RecA/RadA recombinase